jgi:MFS transporter, putative metabolite:H+ symporter
MRYDRNLTDPAAAELSTQSLIARLECLPITAWHIRARIIVGTATFFDAFDVLAISVVLPVLVGQWQLSPGQVGWVISTGFIGQLAGALLFGWIAEKFGRLRAMIGSVAVLALMSLACAMAWNYSALVVFRTIQGIGIGGEVPVAAAYINELSKSHRRGRFFLLYEMLFGIGLTSAGLVGYWAVPRIGWQSMFVVGAAPALLALFLRRLLPESPRWLASQGRLLEADRVVRQMEDYATKRQWQKPLQLAVGRSGTRPTGVTRWQELFSDRYRGRTFTVWAIWFCCYFVTYGLITWLPTIYRTVYKLDVATALRFGLATNVAGLAGDLLAAFTIDRTGRRAWFGLAFTLGALPLAALFFRGAGDVRLVVLCASVSYLFAGSNSLVCYLYTPEIYPTRLRALGGSIATAWLRAASAIGPVVVGFMLTRYDLRSLFLVFALVSLAGGAIASLFAIETRERVLEEVSP